jgi:hypothetical protein
MRSGNRAAPREQRSLLALHDLGLSSCHFRPTFDVARRATGKDFTRQVVGAAEAGSVITLTDGGEIRTEGNTEADYQRVADVANMIGLRSDAGRAEGVIYLPWESRVRSVYARISRLPSLARDSFSSARRHFRRQLD